MNDMNKADMKTVAEGLTAYAIERQNGFERFQQPNAPPWQEARREWIMDILRGMAELDAEAGAAHLPEQFLQRLDEARQCAYTEVSTLKLQQDTIRGLRCYASALEQMNGDQRKRIASVRDLLEDMFIDPRWGGKDMKLLDARYDLEYKLRKLTAQQPIRFTRILLGGEIGPGDSGFVAGAVTSAEDVRGTELYRNLAGGYPEKESWFTICNVYAGAGGIPLRDADEFDMSIIRDAGARFLDEPGVRFLGGGEMTVCQEPTPAMAMTM